MKLLLCPKGHTAAVVFRKLIHFEPNGVEARRYVLVKDAVAVELLKQEGYNVVDPKTCPRDLRVLYEASKKVLGGESLESLTGKISPAKTATRATIPNPVFMLASWTTATASNYPAKITYADTQGNPLSFVFTEDDTLHLCAWCRFKYWLRNKFRKDK